MYKHACPMQIPKRQYGQREPGFLGGQALTGGEKGVVSRTTGEALVLQGASHLSVPLLTLPRSVCTCPGPFYPHQCP